MDDALARPCGPTRRRHACPLLALETLDNDLFRNRVNDININGALFGGQVLAQALHAAIKTVEGRPPNSLHGYFIRSGDGATAGGLPGGAHARRRQLLDPAGHRASSTACRSSTWWPPSTSGDEGWAYELGPLLDAPDPEGLPNLAELADIHADVLEPVMQRRLRKFRTLEIRPTDAERQLVRRSDVARNSFWVRMPSARRRRARVHACALAYASDSWLAGATRMVHAPPGGFRGMQLASLDHAMWFHAPMRADEWILYETDSPWTGSGRGLARGTIYDRQGRLVASTAQEVLMRRERPR